MYYETLPYLLFRKLYNCIKRSLFSSKRTRKNDLLFGKSSVKVFFLLFADDTVTIPIKLQNDMVINMTVTVLKSCCQLRYTFPKWVF